jgi:chromosome segregation ATPase
MPNRVVTVALLWLFVCVMCTGQGPESDLQTLREILVELRAIHEDMRASEATELLVAELQIQQGAVNRATEGTYNAQAKIKRINQDQEHADADLDRLEKAQENATDPDLRNGIAQEIERLKSSLTALKKSERDWNTTLLDREQRLQNAQDRLADIQSQLDSALARLGPAPKGAENR